VRAPAFSIPYVEPLRFTARRIRRGTLVNAAEMMRRQSPERTPLVDFINSLLRLSQR
jgi:hypothetical protein